MRIERRFHDDVRMQIGNGRIRGAAEGAVLPLPLSNCVAKKVGGKTTDPGANCWDFRVRHRRPIARGVNIHAELRLARPC